MTHSPAFQDFADDFPARSRSKGEALVRQGSVHIVIAGADYVVADVHDGRPVRASLRADRGSAVGQCGCVPFWRAADPCAHLFAASLAAHEAGSFLPAPWKLQLSALRSILAEGSGRPVGAVRYRLEVEDAAAAALGEAWVHVEQERRGRDGRPARGEPLRTTPSDLHRLPDAVDRRIHAALHGCPEEPADGRGPARHRFALTATQLEDLLPVLCSSGRFVRGDTGVALVYDPRPWRLVAAVEKGPAGDLEVRGRLRREGEERGLGEVLTFDGAVLDGDRIAWLDGGPLFDWLLELEGAVLRVPGGEALELLRALVRLGADRIALAPEIAPREVRAEPRPRLRLTPWEPRRLAARVAFDYEGHEVPAAAPGDQLSADGALLVVRDEAAERRRHEEGRAAGLRTPAGRDPEAPDYQLAPSRLASAVRDLTRHGWVVEAQGKLYRVPGPLRLRVASGVDWFDLGGTVEFDGQEASLPAILAALRRGEDMVRLGDGTFGMLPEAWLRRNRALLAMGRLEDGAVRFTRQQASVLDALLAEQGEADVDATFARARAGLARVEGVRAAEPPAAFQGTLRPYQKEGLGWLRFLEQGGLGGCLADDMGLGKTVQVLAHFAGQERGLPSLVVAPRSLVFNWREEAARFAPSLRILDHTGPARPREAPALADHDLVLTTYGVLRRDIGWLKDVPFRYAVLDEAQAIKNADSDSAKAARLLRSRHRLALSGTPVENRLDDLWSLFEFLNPGLLGRSSALLAAGAGRTDVDDEGRRLLARVLRPFLLRRTKKQVAPDLPERVEQTVHCELDEAQRAAYDEVLRHYRQALLGRTRREGVKSALFLVLEALLRLRQAACHVGLLDPARAQSPSAKLDALLPLLEEVVAEGSKALVFSQFTSFLALLRPLLEERGLAYEYLDGQTQDRAARVRRFQEDPACRVFLVSLKAGGLGLNLTAADYVFLLDPWWNPAAEAQAIDRAHRIGQSRTVFAYRLVARNTIEEKVLALQESKRALAEAVVRADESILGDLDHAELERLLS